MARLPMLTAAPLVPRDPSLPSLRRAAAGCRACPLWEHGTQTVFGEGPAGALLMFVGEQPGDREDLAGRPFVGPAGRLLDRALAEAGVDRASVYVTNAVKHFKWEPRGKRRLHKRPDEQEMAACRPWLDAEIDVVRPEVVVCLGATAARALLGGRARIRDLRGALRPWVRARFIAVTVHPSAPLRAPDATRHQEIARFLDDIRGIVEELRRRGAEPPMHV